MSTHKAEGDWEHFDDVIHGYRGFATGIGSKPEEDTVESANSELECGDCHGETCGTSGSFERKFVCLSIVRDNIL